MTVRRLCRVVVLFGLVALVASSGPLEAQTKGTEDLDALTGEGGNLYQGGKFAEATEILKQSLGLAETKFGPNHPQVAKSLNNLALLYRAQGRYAEAEPLFKRS